MTIPVVMTSAGRQTQTPTALNTQIIDNAEVLAPGLTANLPGSLVEDVTSSATGAALICDQAVTELIASITPYGANEYILNQQAQVYGVQIGADTNTSVYCVFSGPAGYVIAQGFVVSDGTYQYIIQDGGVVGTNGSTTPLYAVATQSGTWAVPSGTVNQIVTSVPQSITLTVTNPLAGTPGATSQTTDDLRAQVLEAGLASAQSMPRFLKTQLYNVPGVVQRLVSIQQQTGGGWKVLCGGGDPYLVAGAIFEGVADVSTLVGSIMGVTGITQANPGVVTVDLNHGFSTGQVINISGIVGMTELNNIPLTITVLSETTFSIGVNTSTYTAYVSGGVVTPNYRNITATVVDFPDSYSMLFVNPPQQTVTMSVTWNTTMVNAVSNSTISQLAAPALISYVNTLTVGQPMNLFQIQQTFANAVAESLNPEFLTRMLFSVYINNVLTAPESGTGIIAGDPESYFYASASAITIAQG